MKLLRVNIWHAVVASAFILSCSFFWPIIFCWSVFVFLIPLYGFILSHNGRVAFVHGFTWGFIFYTCNTSALLCVVAQRGSGFIRFPLFFLLLVYLSVPSGFWFSGTTYFAALLRFGRVGRCLVFTLGAIVYFIFIRFVLCQPFGIADYIFVYPLLPFAQYRALLWSLPYLGSVGLLVCLILFSFCLTCTFVYRTSSFFFLSCVFFLPLFIGFVLPWHNDQLFPLHDQVCIISPGNFCESHPMDRAQEINTLLAQAVSTHPSARFFVLPESSYPFPMNHHQGTIDQWFDNALSHKTYLVVGAHRQVGSCSYNTLYVLHDGGIVDFYDKSCLVDFVEHVPSWCRHFSWARTLFLDGKKIFMPCGHKKNFCINNFFTISPFICSELLLNVSAVGKVEPSFIICVANDSWFCLGYMRQLCLLAVRYAAIEYQKNICYAAHHRGALVSLTGRVIDPLYVS